MSIWGFFGLLALVAVMIASLYLSKLANRRAEAEFNQRDRIRAIRVEIISLDEVIRTLLVYDRNPALLQLFINYSQKRCQDGLALLPNDETLQQDLNDLARLQAQVDQLGNERQEPEVPSSDRQVYLMKKHFGKAIKLLNKTLAEGLITEVQVDEHRLRLGQESLMLEVKAYRHQAEIARADNDLSSAGSFLKHAKEIMLNSDLNFPQKSEELKDISRAIADLYITLKDTEEGAENEQSDNRESG